MKEGEPLDIHRFDLRKYTDRQTQRIVQLAYALEVLHRITSYHNEDNSDKRVFETEDYDENHLKLRIDNAWRGVTIAFLGRLRSLTDKEELGEEAQFVLDNARENWKKQESS